MQHIIITVSADGRKCHLKPESRHMLQRGVCPNLYSEADGVKNTQRELSQWRAVAVSVEAPVEESPVVEAPAEEAAPAPKKSGKKK